MYFDVFLIEHFFHTYTLKSAKSVFKKEHAQMSNQMRTKSREIFTTKSRVSMNSQLNLIGCCYLARVTEKGARVRSPTRRDDGARKRRRDKEARGG